MGRKLTQLEKAIRAVDACMGILAGPNSAAEEAWGIVKAAAQNSATPQDNTPPPFEKIAPRLTALNMPHGPVKQLYKDGLATGLRAMYDAIAALDRE